MIRDVIAPCPVIGRQINGRNLGTARPINIKPRKGTSAGPRNIPGKFQSDRTVNRAKINK